MPTPHFVLALREKVGTDPLPLVGVSGIVTNAAGEVLLGRRADSGEWALVSGIADPGEQPADAFVREVLEETAVAVTVDAVLSVDAIPEVVYANGDRAHYLDVCFVARHVSGEARVNDDENLDVGWFASGALPPLRESSWVRLARWPEFAGRTWFAPQTQGEYAAGPSHAAYLATVMAAGREVTLRRAVSTDLPALVALLADDQLGARREGPEPDLTPYRRALAIIDADPAHLLVVAENCGEVVGTLQLSFLPGLARQGALRGQVEAVRVAREHRGGGLGEAMFRWAIAEATRRGCALVQLTSDKNRRDAHRFYDRLGFVASHEGYKLHL